MADWKQLLKLGGRAGKALGSYTAPQELLGGLGLLKDAVTGNASNFRLGPEGEVMYDSREPGVPASAMGSFVKTDPSASDADVVKHELRHVAQSDLLGPAFLAAAIPEAVSNAALDTYGGLPLERDAISHATPQSEILREGSSMYQKDRIPPGTAFLKGLLR